MKIKTILVTIAAFCGICITSCQDDNLDVLNPNDQKIFLNWSHVFESYWDGMNYSYAFWDIDPTDWDEVYREYSPKFDGLEFGVKEDSIAAANLFEEICSNLIDHHYTLALKDGNGKVWKKISPGKIEVQSRDYYHDKYSFEDIKNVIKHNEDLGRITHQAGVVFENDFAVWSYLLDGDIACLGLNIFSISENANDEVVEEVMENFYSLINETENLKGIIIDTRNNPGGRTDDLFLILRPLLSEPIHFGYTRTKNGLGRLDYTPWTPLILEPFEPDENPVERNLKDVPVVALADINSVSMAEITPIAIMAMPNGFMIGERTVGGHGPLNGNINDFYAGELENKAFLMYTSTSMTKRADGVCYEGYGVVPDIEALFNAEEFSKGNDTQLYRAAEFIHTGK
ncbi:MAG: hypothetical protein DBY35_12875 [Bacteroidales bacterium]|nr:MAG: hypothetical protein DBY35_12875 [Bacteroidales bacterium]